MNILQLTFDYGKVKLDTTHLKIDKESKTLRGTWSVETEDDLYYANSWHGVFITTWSRYYKQSLFYHAQNYYISRNYTNSDRNMFDNFVTATSGTEAENYLLNYNTYLANKTIRTLNRVNKLRQKLWMEIFVPDIIHTPTSWFTIKAWLLLRSHFQAPLVSTLHVNEEELQNIESFRLPWADIILKYDMIAKTASDYVIAKNSNIYKVIYPLNSNVIEVNNDISIDASLFTPSPKTQSVMYVWRLSFEKWFDRLVAIAKKLNLVDIDLHICWKHLGLDPQITALYEELISLKNVYNHGHLPKQELFRVMDQSKIIILPSRTEIFNQAILEGWYYGCDPISTNVGAAQSCVMNKDNLINDLQDQNIIEAFYNRIVKSLETYTPQRSKDLHDFYTYYASNNNKIKKLNFFSSVIRNYVHQTS